MTIAQLLERLERKRDAIDSAIQEIKSIDVRKSTRAKAAAIIESVKRGPYKKRKLHWTQRLSKKQRTAFAKRMNAARYQKEGS